MSVRKMICAAGAVVCVLLFVAGTIVCPLLFLIALTAFGSADPMVRELAPRFVGLASAAALFVLGIWLLGHAFLEALWPDRVRPLGRS
jgi:uncharacterized membrane protein